jgi:phage-related protein
MNSSPMKEILWLGDSLNVVRKFPESARVPIGDALNALQHGQRPVDTKALRAVGSGVAEIRVHDEANNQFRDIYFAKLADVVHALHAFQKKTQKTRKADLDLATDRLKELRRMLRESNKR